MRKNLTYFSFIAASFVIVIAFVTATTYTQLGIAVLLFPLFVYFAFKVFPRKTRRVYHKQPIAKVQPAPIALSRTVEAEPRKESREVVDIDKRAFLKLVGAAGLSIFLSSIFIKKAEATLFGTATGPITLQDTNGKKINPAVSQPTDGYRIAEIDDAIISYYGFTNTDGAWFIMREDTDNGSFRYVKGDSNLSNNWVKRARLNYDYFNNVF